MACFKSFMKSQQSLGVSVYVLLALIVPYGGYSLHAIRGTQASVAAAASEFRPSSPGNSQTSTLGAIKEHLLKGRTRFELMLPPNYPSATQVYVSVFPSNLINVNDELEIVHMQFAITLEWHDSRLQWQHLARKYSALRNENSGTHTTASSRATDHNSSSASQHKLPPISKTIIFYPHEIWIPPITIRQRLYSIGTPTASASAEHYLQNSLVDVGYVEGTDNGTMLMIGYFLDAWSCKMRTKLFPFDTQLCHFTLHATTNVRMVHRPFFENVEQMREDYYTFRRVTGSGFQTGEWTYDPEITLALLREPAQFYWTKYGESFVKYRVTLTRKPGQHVITWIVPAILLSLGAIIGLYLGCDPSERYSFGAAVIVTLTLMLIGLTDRLPVGEDGFPVLGELYFGLCSTVIIGTFTSTLPEAVRRRYDASKTAAARSGSVLRRISAASSTSGIVVIGPSNNNSAYDLSSSSNRHYHHAKQQRAVAFTESQQQQNSNVITDCSNLNGDIAGSHAQNTPTTMTSTVFSSTPPSGGVNNNNNTSDCLNTTSVMLVEDAASLPATITIPPQELTLLYNPLAVSPTSPSKTSYRQAVREQPVTVYRNMQQTSAASVDNFNSKSSASLRCRTGNAAAPSTLLRVQSNYHFSSDASPTGGAPGSGGVNLVRRSSRMGTIRRRMSQYQHYGGRGAAAVKEKFQTSVVLDYILMFTFLTIQLLMILYAIIKWVSGPTAASFLLYHQQNPSELQKMDGGSIDGGEAVAETTSEYMTSTVSTTEASMLFDLPEFDNVGAGVNSGDMNGQDYNN